MDNELHIVELTAENLMRLKAVEIRPAGPVVRIEGKNCNGKTSVMTAIVTALGRKELCPSRPIRDGEKSARVAVNLGDFVVERNWTSNDKSYLKITHKEGHPIGSPRAFLDKLLGSLSFDPMAFVQMGGTNEGKKKRAEVLRQVAGLDFTAEKIARESAYTERRDVNRDLDTAKKERRALGDVPEIKKVRPIEEVQAEYDETKAWNDAIPTQEQINDAAEEFAEAQAALAEAEKKLEALQGAAKRKPKDMTKISAELNAAREAGETAFKIERARKLDSKVRKLDHKSKDLTAQIEMADANVAEKIRNAKWPIDGLSVGEDDEVLYDGVPFEQASRAQQTRVAMAIGMAQNPRIRVILINDGSLCDKSTMAEIERIAAENRYQVWVERVAERKSSGEKGSVFYVEDGSVR